MKLFDRFQFSTGKSVALTLLFSSALLISACGNSDAKFQIKKFCSQIKIGESIMAVVSRAGKVEFDKYWLEKFDKEPSKGEIIGIIRPRDLEKKTEKLKKLKNPKTWAHGQFNAMVQEFGYSRHVCSVKFAKDKVLGKKVISLD